MKKKDVIKMYSQNGEVHLILKEHNSDDQIKRCNTFNVVEFRAIMKKEAEKPLLLLRA